MVGDSDTGPLPGEPGEQGGGMRHSRFGVPEAARARAGDHLRRRHGRRRSLALREPADRADPRLFRPRMVRRPAACGPSGCTPMTAAGCWRARTGSGGVKPDDAALEYRMLHRDGRTSCGCATTRCWRRRRTGPALARRAPRHHRPQGGRGRARAARRPAGGGGAARRARAGGSQHHRSDAGGGERRGAHARRRDRRRCGSSSRTSTAWCAQWHRLAGQRSSEGCATRRPRDPRRGTRC